MGHARVKQEFSEYLASITDEDQRRAVVRQALLDAVNTAPAEAFEPPIKTARDYLNTKIELPPIVIGTEEFPVLVRGGMNARIARAGKGKTVGALNQLIRWSAGLPWLDTWVDKHGDPYYTPQDGPVRVLVIENEGAGSMFHRQLGLMFHAGAPFLTDSERELALDNLHIWGDGGYAGIKLDDPEKLKRVREGVEKYRPDIVLIEPFRGLWNGDENSSTDMGRVADSLVEMASDFQCAVLLTHHENKSGGGEGGEDMSRARGSTVLEGVVTVMENWQGAKGDEYRELTQSKNRHGTKTPPVRLEWDSDAWWYTHVPDDNLADGIMVALQESDEPLTVSDLSEMTGEKDTKVRQQLKKMAESGRIKTLASVSNGRGSTGLRYRLPQEGNNGGLAV